MRVIPNSNGWFVRIGLMLASSATVWAQGTGSIFGVVTDSNGALVTGTVVVLTSGEHRTEAVSGQNGEFSFDRLSGGKYGLQTSHDGFGRTTVELIDLAPAQVIRLPNIPMALPVSVCGPSGLVLELADDRAVGEIRGQLTWVRISSAERGVLAERNVELVPLHSDESPERTKSDADGRYRFRLTQPGDFEVVSGNVRVLTTGAPGWNVLLPLVEVRCPAAGCPPPTSCE